MENIPFYHTPLDFIPADTFPVNHIPADDFPMDHNPTDIFPWIIFLKTISFVIPSYTF